MHGWENTAQQRGSQEQGGKGKDESLGSGGGGRVTAGSPVSKPREIPSRYFQAKRQRCLCDWCSRRAPEGSLQAIQAETGSLSEQGTAGRISVQAGGSSTACAQSLQRRSPASLGTHRHHKVHPGETRGWQRGWGTK